MEEKQGYKHIKNKRPQDNWEYFDKHLFAIQQSTRPKINNILIQKLIEKLRIKFRWYYYWRIDPIYLYDNPDDQIYAIQQSTRTTIKPLQPLHEYFRLKSTWYYKWHIRPVSHKIHWAVLAIYNLFIISTLIFNLLAGYQPTKATGNCSWKNRQDICNNNTSLKPNNTNNLDRPVFSSKSSPSFTLDTDSSIIANNKKTDRGTLAISDKKITTTIRHNNQVVNLNPDILSEANSDQFTINVPLTQQFKPGKYQLAVHLENESMTQSIEQDFLWGVLAMNFDQSTYQVDQPAQIYMATLDDNGYTLCDSSLWLTITDPLNNQTILSTTDQTISISNTCMNGNVTNKPDYFTNYTPKSNGTYRAELRAQTKNGERLMIESFEVTDTSDFIVSRPDTSMRLYVKSNYTVNLNVIAKKDTSAIIKEKVPTHFEILQISNNGQITDKNDDSQIISWPAELKAGETTILSYQYRSPDLSPEFFLLGPLTINDSNKNNSDKLSWTEPRAWQIASDSVVSPLASSYAADGSLGGWTNPTYAYNDDGSQYATVTGSSKNAWYGNTFGFDLSAIPDGATINSVSITAEWHNSAADTSGPVLLVGANSGGSLVGSTTDTSGQLADEVVTYSPTGLTAANLKATGASGFNAVLRFRRTDNTAHTAYVDYVKCTVDYSTESTVSGSLYDAIGGSKITAAKTIKVSVNGATATSNTSSSGDFTVTTSSVITANSIVSVFVDGDTVKASTITKVSAAGNLTGINLYSGYTTIRHEGTITSLANIDIATADNVADTDLLASADGSNHATFTQGIYVLAAKTYAPGANTILAGSFNNAGTFTPGTNTLEFNASSGTQTVTPGTASFYNFTHSGSGTAQMASALYVTNTLTNSAGTLDINSKNIYLGGSLNNTATISNATASTLTFTGSGSSNTFTSGGASFGNIIVGNGLVAHYKLDEGGSSSTTVDSTGDGPSGTLYNTQTWATDTPNSSYYGGDPYGVTFNGSSSYIGTSDSDVLDTDTGSFTVAGWVNPASTAKGRFVNKWYESTTTGFDFDINATGGGTATAGYIRCHISSDTSDLDLGANASLAVGTWTHIAFTVDREKQEFKFYANGSQIGSTTSLASFTGTFANPAGLGIGVIPSVLGSYMNGSADDIRLYKRALSTAELSAIYSGEKAEKTTTGAWSLSDAFDANGTFNIYSGTLDLNDQNVNLGGNVTVESGTLTKGTGTVTLDGSLTYTDYSGTANFGPVAIGGTSKTVDLATDFIADSVSIASGDTFNTNGYEMDIGGNISISSTGTLNATDDVETDNSLINLTGSWSNSGTFTADASTVTFDGTNQSISGSTTFYNFSKTDSTNDTTDLTLTFDNTANQTIGGLLTLDGLDADDRVNLVSDSPGTQWSLTANGTFAIDYVDTADSDASTGLLIQHTNTVDSGRNLNWGFATNTISVSGTCKAFNQSTNCTDGQTVKVAVGGSLSGSTTTTSSGSFTISSVGVETGNIVTVFLDNVADANEAVAITKYDGTDNITGLTLYAEHLTIGSDDSATLTNAYLSSYDNSVSSDEDVFFEVDTNDDLTVDYTSQSTQERLYIKASNAFRPDSSSSGNVTTHNLQNAGTLTADGNTFNLTGSWLNSGTFNANTSTVNMKASGSTGTITSGGSPFNNLNVDPGQTYSLLSDNLAAYYRLDEGTGTTVYDSTEASPSGSFSGAPSWTSSVPNTSYYGGDPYGLTFDGSDDYVYTADSDNLDVGTGSFTVAGWVKPGSTAKGRFVSKWYESALTGWNFDINAGADGAVTAGHIRIHMRDGVTDLDFHADASLSVGTWTHIAVTVNRSTNELKFYANGSQIGSTESISTMTGSLSNTTNFGIGVIPSVLGSYMNASADDVRLYKDVLTQTEVNTIYTNGEVVTGTASTYTLQDALSINGDIALTADTLDANGQNISVAGNWTNAGTFTAGSGTVTFTGNASAHQTITTDGQAFYNLVINNDEATYDQAIISGALDVNGDLTLTDGTLKLDTNNPNVTLAGDLTIASGGTWTKGSGTLTFDGTTAATLTDSNSTLQNLGTVVINKTDTSAPSTNNKVSLGSSVTVDDLEVDGTLLSEDYLDLGILGSYVLTVNDTGVTTIGANGEISGSNTLRLLDTAGSYLGTTGTLSSKVKFETATTDVTIPARTYAGIVQPYNNTTTNYNAILGNGTHNYSSNFNPTSEGSGTLTIQADTNDPTVNLSGDLTTTRTGGNIPIALGSGTWTISGNWNTTNDGGWISQDGSSTAPTAGKVIFDGASTTVSAAAYPYPKFYDVEIADSLTLATSQNGIAHEFKVDAGVTVTISGTWYGGTVTTLDSTSTLSGSGTLFFWSASQLATDVATINCKVTFWGTGEVYPRTFGGLVKIYSNNTNNYSINLGTGSSQTINFNGGLTLAAEGTGIQTVLFNTYNPTVNITGNFLATSLGPLSVNLGASTVNVSGSVNFASTTLAYGTSTINLTGVNQSLTGSQTYYNLSKADLTDDSTDRILTIDDTSTITIATGGTFTLDGYDDNDRVNVVSDSPGTPWELIINGSVSINYADVADSDASGGTQVDASDGTNFDSDGNTNWNFGTISIGGSCKAFDQSTNCTDSQTIKVAVNGTLKAQTTTTSAGSFTITGVTVATGNIVTVFIDGVADGSEAVAVTKYDGSGNITGVLLYAEHLTVGSDDNQSLTNTDLANYDNSVSSDEDIFFEVDANNDLTVDSTAQSTQERLLIVTGNTFQPDSTSSGNVTTHHIQIVGTVTADGNTFTVGGSWNNLSGTFTRGTSTVIFTGTGSINVDNANFWGAGKQFRNVTINTSGTITLASAIYLESGGKLTLTSGTLTGNYEIFVFALTADATTVVNNGVTYSNPLPTISFKTTAGTSSSTPVLIPSLSSPYPNVNVYSDSAVTRYAKLSGAFTTNGSVQIKTNQASGQMDLDTNGETVTIGTYLQLGSTTLTTVGGILHTKTSTVSIGDYLSVYASDSSYENNLDAGSATISIGGNWTNNDTFTAGTSTVDFTKSSSTQIINSGGTGTGKDFYNITHSGAGTLQLLTNNIKATGNFLNSGGTFTTLDSGDGTTSRNVTVDGNFTINNSSTFTANASTITVGGNVDISASTFNYNTSTMELTGTSPSLTTGTQSLYQLKVITAGQTVTLVSAATFIRGTLTLGSTSGTKATLSGSSKWLYLYTNTTPLVLNGTYNASPGYLFSGISVVYEPTANAAFPGGTFPSLYFCSIGNYTVTLGGAITTGSLNIYNYSNANTTILDTGGYALNLSSLNIANASYPQKLGKLVANNSVITVSGDVNILAGTNGNNILEANSSTIKVGGNWTNADTFTAGTSTIEFTKSSSTQTVNSGGTGTGKAFYNLTHSGAGTLQIITNSLDINGNFTNSAGTFDTNSLDMTVAGSWNNASTFTPGTRTVIFDGTSTGKTINTGGTGAGKVFYNVVFNGSGGAWSPLTNAMTITNDLTMAGGTFDTSNGTANVIVNGNVTCGDSTCGTINMTSTNTFTQSVAANKSFGTSVAGTTAWTFNNLTFSVSDATTHTIATSTTASGDITINGVLNIASSATWDAGNRTYHLMGSGTPFTNNGTFTSNTSTFSYENATSASIVTPADNAQGYYNLQTSPASGTPTYTFKTTTTSFLAGTKVKTENGTKNIEDFKIGDKVLSYNPATNQPVMSEITDTINGIKDSYYVINDKIKATGNHVFILSNNSQKKVEDLKIGDVLKTYSGQETIQTIEKINRTVSVYDIEVKDYHLFYAEDYLVHNWVGSKTLVINNNLTLAGAGNATVTSSFGSVLFTIAVNGNFSIGANQTFTAPPVLSVGGNFTNSSTFTSGTYTVNFTKTSGTQTLNSGGTGTGKAFYNITHSGTGTLQLITNNLDVNGNLTNSAGILDGNSLNFYVSGSWSNSATFTPGTGNVTFDGTATGKTINPGSSSFYNLTFNGTNGAWSPLTNTVTVIGSLYMTAGTFDTSNGTANVVVNNTVSCTIGSCGVINMASTNTFTQNVATNRAFGTDVGGTTAWTFYNLTFTSSSGTPTIATSTYANGGITVNNNLSIGANTTFDAGNRIWTVKGNFSNAGNLTPSTSTFDFAKASGTQTVNNNSSSFNNLTHSGAGTLQLTTSALDVNGNFTNSAGTFDANGQNINVAKNWDISGGLFSAGATPGTQTVTFDGTTATTISGSSTFNNLVMNTTTDGAKQINFTNGTTQTINGTWTLDGDTSKVLTLRSSTTDSPWYFDLPSGMTSGDYIDVQDSYSADINKITPGTNVTNSGNNDGWIFNSTPTNDLLGFTNAYTGFGNTAVADNTTEWNFQVKASDADGPTDINYIELRLANNSDSTQPYDALKYRWTELSHTFSEEADTQNAASISSNSTYSNTDNQWIINFKILFNDSFASKSTNYAVEVYTIDDSNASDTDNYSNTYQVVSLTLSISVDNNTLSFGNLLPGNVITGSTIVTANTNYPNGYSLAVSDSATGSNSSLLHTDTTTRIADYAGSIATPTSWNGYGLGICVYQATSKTTSQWGTGTTETDSNNKYAGVPETATTIHTKNSSPTTNDLTYIGYKLVVENSQKTGDYSGNITYTATGLLN